MSWIDTFRPLRIQFSSPINEMAVCIYFCLIHARSMLNCFPEQKICDVPKGLKLLEEKVSGNTLRLVFLYPPVERALGSGILIFGRHCVHWSHSICSKEYSQNVPSPPGEERASAYLMPNDWGEGGDEQPFIWAVTLFRKTTPSWEVGLPSGHQRIHHRRFHRQVRFH